MKKTNGVNQLTQDQELMRMNVVDLELKARFWKAQHDIRYYTLEAEALQERYNQWLEDQQTKNEKALADLQEQIANTPDLKVEESAGENTEPLMEVRV